MVARGLPGNRLLPIRTGTTPRVRTVPLSVADAVLLQQATCEGAGLASKPMTAKDQHVPGRDSDAQAASCDDARSARTSASVVMVRVAEGVGFEPTVG